MLANTLDPQACNMVNKITLPCPKVTRKNSNRAPCPCWGQMLLLSVALGVVLGVSPQEYRAPEIQKLAILNKAPTVRRSLEALGITLKDMVWIRSHSSSCALAVSQDCSLGTKCMKYSEVMVVRILYPHSWVAVKELKLSYYIGETLLFTIYTHYGNLI